MPTECSQDSFDFGTVEGRAVVGAFDGGEITSDAGALLLGQTRVASGAMLPGWPGSRRHPRYRVIEDDMKTQGRLRVIAKQWALCNKKAREDLERLGKSRVLSFRYEDLIASPDDMIRKIYDHCGLACSAEILRRVRETVDPGRQEKWHRLDRQQLATIMPEIQREMEFYGYELPHAIA